MQKNENRPGYKKTKVGWIPEGWECDLLENHSKRGSGHTPNKKISEYYKGSIVWISLADSSALDQGIISKSRITISEEGIKNSSAVLHPKGTVLLSRDAGVGKSAIAGCDLCVSQHFIAWTCDKPSLGNWFLYHYLQLKKREFERIAVGSTIKTIGLPYFKKYELPLPPLPEQEAIAGVLGCWDKAIRTLEKKIEKKRLIKKGLMQKLLSGKTRLPSFSKVWKTVKLGNVCGTGINIEKGSPLIKKNTKAGGSIPVVAGGQTYAYYHEHSTHEIDCITISASGAYAGFVWHHDYPIWASDCNVIYAVDGCLKFFYFFLKANQGRIYALQTGGAQPHVYAKDLKTLTLGLPPLEEQQAIAEVLSAADGEIEALERKLVLWRDQKKYLLNNLVTGTLRLPEFREDS